MLGAATPDFSVMCILFLNISIKFPEGPDGTGFTSWLAFRLSLDLIIWDLFWFSCNHVWLYPTPNFSLSALFLLSQWLVLTWSEKEIVPQLGDCFILSVQARCDPFQLWMIVPLCHWPRTWTVLQDVLQSVPGAARFHYLFSHYASKQKSIISAAVCPCLQTVQLKEGFTGFICAQLYLMNISWGFLNNTVFKITKIQSLQMLLWTFHSHAQTVLHVLCRQGEIISKEASYAILDDILLLPNHFFCSPFFSLSAPSYINSVSSSFRDRWWAGGTNELPAAQGRLIEMLCVLRANRLSTLTEDVTHVMKGLMHKYCSRFFSLAPMNRVSPREQLPKTAFLTVWSLLCLLEYCSDWYNNLSLLWRWREH